MITTYSREELEEKYGKVWDTKELQKDFEVLGFLAPHIACNRKADNIKGSMEFQHSPRIYYGFSREDGKNYLDEGKEKPKTIRDILGIKTDLDVDIYAKNLINRIFPDEKKDNNIK